MKKDLTLNEYIEETGQESETKAAKVIKEVQKDAERKNQQEVDRIHTVLEGQSKYKFDDYKRSLAEVMDQSCFRENFPLGWRYHITVTYKGLIMILLSPDRRRFTRAFSPCNVPQYDFVAMEKIIESAWVAINRWKDEKNSLVWTP